MAGFVQNRTVLRQWHMHRAIRCMITARCIPVILMSMQCAMTLQKDHNHRILAIHRWHRVRHAHITCHMHTSHAHISLISDQLHNNCFACMVCAPHPSSHYQTPVQPTLMVQRHHTDAPQHDLSSDTRISHCESDCFASSHWYMHREAFAIVMTHCQEVLHLWVQEALPQ